MTATVLPYDDIVWACTNLCDLIEYENEVLARFDTEAVKEVSENKAALARIYEQAVLPMAEDPSLAEALEPEQKEELTALAHRLKELVEENARRLTAVIGATNMVLDSVVQAAKEQAADSPAYSKSGTMMTRRSSDATSLAYNDKL